VERNLLLNIKKRRKKRKPLPRRALKGQISAGVKTKASK